MSVKALFGKIGTGLTRLGKKAAGEIQGIGKKALSGAKVVSGALDFAVQGTKKIASEVEKIPVLGVAAKSLLDTPLGQQVKSVFNTAEDINQALHEAIMIGDKVDKLGDRIASLSSSELKSKEVRADLVKASISIGRDIKRSNVGKKASRIPVVKKSIADFNRHQKSLQKKIGKDDVQKIKKAIVG